ncbi:hypothetical protein ACQKPC_24545 [Pseudomonas sp. NPDC089918]|uniref:hypothetical protein n=1 Tax=Pseudomonas sp. NPDC089918 TaxID=3390654 RepID=UPI003CFD40B7
MSSNQNGTTAASISHVQWRDSVYRKIAFRLLPCLFVGYLLAGAAVPAPDCSNAAARDVSKTNTAKCP